MSEKVKVSFRERLQKIASGFVSFFDKVSIFFTKIGGFFGTALKWIAYDGLQHIAACFAISVAGMLVFDSWWKGLILGVLAGVMKEIYDLFIAKTGDWKRFLHDGLCDLIGIGVAVGLFFINLMIR